MTTLPIQTPETAQPGAAEILSSAKAQNGFVPNLYGTLANSPLALEAYTSLAKTIAERSTLSLEEQQTAMISVSIENGCDYCVAAHSTIAGFQGIADTVVDAIRDGSKLPSERLEAVRDLSLALVRKRGWLDPADLERFTQAGFEESQALDLVTVIALKTLSNFTNHIASTPLDAAFAARRYERVA